MGKNAYEELLDFSVITSTSYCAEPIQPKYDWFLTSIILLASSIAALLVGAEPISFQPFDFVPLNAEGFCCMVIFLATNFLYY